MKFEAHITFDRKYVAGVYEISKMYNEWKFSQFDADPVMGDKPYCYLTSYNVDSTKLLNEMGACVAFAELDGIHVLRQKIERIIYDTKTGLNELGD